MYKFAREIACDRLFEEIGPLLFAHYKEIAHYQDIELAPDWQKYKEIEHAGMLRVYVARDETTDQIVGYSVYAVRTNLHYKRSLQAHQDILFIDKERRGFGRHFIMWCDEQLKLEGVQAVYHHVKAQHNFGPLLERLGYQLVDLIFSKRLDIEGK